MKMPKGWTERAMDPATWPKREVPFTHYPEGALIERGPGWQCVVLQRFTWPGNPAQATCEMELKVSNGT